MDDTKKREKVISWDDYFMGVAIMASMRSKDPSTQVGTCIVSSSNKIIGTGYNGFPVGCSDDDYPWSKPEKYKYVVHAEANAILNSSCDLK
ncbi:hypothetical protein RZS08_19795, partial [Arthrospira platensis SPKY1]|nr:hypothetical protein [Arthrospira platensis SPKY1]